ncbi:MAG TPA: transposase [Chthoniobacterales bacterium]
MRATRLLVSFNIWKSLGGRSKVVIEACWNWGKVYDTPQAIPAVEEVVLAHPLKIRLIADAQIKTDKLDARALALLLRGGFIARAHVPAPATRRRKNLLRQRLCWSRMRTRLRNRVHALVDRQQETPPLPQCSDLFGRKGAHALDRLELPARDDCAITSACSKSSEARCKSRRRRSPPSMRPILRPAALLSIPGVGQILAAVIAAEIDAVERFPDASRLCAYAGLVPTTHASGGKIYHGRLLSSCNKWLRWAFIEAAWVAIGCSPYFGALLPPAQGAGQGGQHRHPHCRPSDVHHRLEPLARGPQLCSRATACRQTPTPNKNPHGG